MSSYQAPDTEFQAVADAIRTKGGTSAQLEWPQGFVDAVGAISGGGSTLITKTITANGTYNASDDNADGYSQVTVNVSGGVLPAGYTALSYLESDGTQYLDTGIKAQGGLFASVDFEFTQSNGWSTVIGGADANINKSFLFAIYTLSKFTYQYGTNNYRDITRAFSTGQKYQVWVGNQISIDMNCYLRFDKSEFESAANVYLFINNRNGTLANPFYGKIYKAEMWLDGQKVREFVPCSRDSDSELGMYDLVNDVFYTNAGTGSFAGA